MVQRVSVRRARIEEDRARRQIFIVGGISLLLGLIFLFVIFPLMLRGVIFLAQQNSTGTEEIKPLPPQAPMVAAPDRYSNTGTFELTGYTSPEVEVTLLANEQILNTTKSDGEGTFTFPVSVNEGEYTLYLYATGQDKNTSPDSAKYSVIVDKTKPSLTVESPQDGTTFTLRREQTLTIKGKLSEAGFVVLNGNSRIRTAQTGEFQTQVQLQSGENTFTLVGEDLAGNVSDQVERKVTWLQ